MCLQCSTNAVLVARDVLPGVSLFRSVVGHRDWPAGWYGLVESNDPFHVFPTLMADPKFTDEELEAQASDTVAAENAYEADVTAFRDNLNLSFTTAGEIFVMCQALGYERTVHGFVEYWLMDHIARKVTTDGAAAPIPGA